MPKVSVIMGIYNTNNENMVKTAIDSILSQTYYDLEFIICDDGSTDGTYEMVKDLIKDDVRVILIKNEVNCGLAATLNKCLHIAKGKYIARMDADDISLSTRIEEQVLFLDNNPEYAMVGCCAELFDDEGIWGSRDMTEFPQNTDFLFNPPFIHASILVKKEIYNLLNGYRVAKETLRTEDYDLFMRLYSLNYKGYNLPKRLYQIREDENAYKRRSYKFRLDEAKVRYKGFKQLGLMPKAFIYVLKPLIVGLIPQTILSVLRGERLLR